jgi:preprotein translocase subunit SecY
MPEKQDSKPRAFQMTEEYQSRASVLIYTVAAIAVGYASLQVAPLAGNMLTILIGLVLAWVVGKLVQVFLGKKDTKWLLGNGIFIYLFVWLVSWIFFFNLMG